jgi:hypothetical protein
MKIPINETYLCPQYKGQAVCFDVTDLKLSQTPYGPKKLFKIGFEVKITRDDGSPHTVYSKPLARNSDRRSALTDLLKSWYRKPSLEPAWWLKFDTEDLIGRTAELVVVHKDVDGKTYANIMQPMPDLSDSPLRTSGRNPRMRDRQKDTSNGAYQSTSSTPQLDGRSDLIVHVGRWKGRPLKGLTPDQVQALVDIWLPTAKLDPNASNEDKQLIAALELFMDDLPD